MAIEIIPKEEISRPIRVLNILFFVGISLLILVVAGYFYLNYLTEKKSQTIKKTEETILQMRTPEVENLEKSILGWREIIEDYNFLFNSHEAPTNIFNFLERTTHPKVWWVDFTFDSYIPNNLRLKGIAQDFSSLQQQLIIFQNETLVKRITLNQVYFGKTGGVEFELEISLAPEILTPKIPSLGQLQ